MTKSPSAAPKIAQKLCIICGEAIPSAAVKCTKCDSFQDWRRYVTFSTTMVALATAFVSVIAATAPSLMALFVKHDSKIDVGFQADDDQSGILLLVSNYGDRAGGIDVSNVTLTVPYSNNPKTYVGKVDEKVGTTVLLPQVGEQLRVTFDVGTDKPTDSQLQEECKVVVNTVEFSKVSNPYTILKKCVTFSTLRTSPPAN